MLNECIEIFAKQKDIDRLLLENYVLADGSYLIIEYKNDGSNPIIGPIGIKQDKKTRTIGISNTAIYSKICELDYSSKLVDMNKPIDSSKIIQSNNFMAFWIKKENLTNGKLTDKIIDQYFELLSNPAMKYLKSSKDKALYKLIEKEVGQVNLDVLESNRDWIKNNIRNLPFDIVGKDYLKIFFIHKDVDIVNEGKRYVVPNIFNKNDYNVLVEGDILGLPNYNMGTNSKKIYLENKTRKTKVPIIESIDQAYLKKKFFDFLLSLSAKGLYNIFFDSDNNEINAYDNSTMPTRDFKGYYLRIRKEKNEAAICEMDVVTSYKVSLQTPLYIYNYFDIDAKYCEGVTYGKVTKMYEVRNIINEVFFSKLLNNNFFTEASDLPGYDGMLKRSIMLSRNSLFDWFYKGNQGSVEFTLDKISLNLIKNSVFNGYITKAKHQFNLKLSLKEFFKGGNNEMEHVMKTIWEVLGNKINENSNDKYLTIDSDNEYYYAVGQLVSFFISLNRSKAKTHSLANPFFNVKSDKLLKEKLGSYFKKYNYDINVRSKRFNNLFKMVKDYIPDEKPNESLIIAGYIANSLIYEKREEQ